MKVKVISLKKNKENDFYKKIIYLKVINKLGYKINIKYNGKQYIKYDDGVPKEIEEIIKIINIIN